VEQGSSKLFPLSKVNLIHRGLHFSVTSRSLEFYLGAKSLPLLCFFLDFYIVPDIYGISTDLVHHCEIHTKGFGGEEKLF
jgi:hypothetical protein